MGETWYFSENPVPRGVRNHTAGSEIAKRHALTIAPRPSPNRRIISVIFAHVSMNLVSSGRVYFVLVRISQGNHLLSERLRCYLVLNRFDLDYIFSTLLAGTAPSEWNYSGRYILSSVSISHSSLHNHPYTNSQPRRRGWSRICKKRGVTQIWLTSCQKW